MGLRLSQTVAEIYASGIPVAECRMLARTAVVTSLRGHGAERSAERQDEVDYLEQALHVVAQLAGCSGKIAVSKAKCWLREQGGQGPQLASRLSRLSKTRNSRSHPDVSLVDHMRGLAASEPDGLARAEDSTEVDSSVDSGGASPSDQGEVAEADNENQVSIDEMSNVGRKVNADHAVNKGPVFFSIAETVESETQTQYSFPPCCVVVAGWAPVGSSSDGTQFANVPTEGAKPADVTKFATDDLLSVAHPGEGFTALVENVQLCPGFLQKKPQEDAPSLPEHFEVTAPVQDVKTESDNEEDEAVELLIDSLADAFCASPVDSDCVKRALVQFVQARVASGKPRTLALTEGKEHIRDCMLALKMSKDKDVNGHALCLSTKG